MSKKILAVIKKCLTLVIVQLSQNTMMIQTNQSLEKTKDETCCVTIEEFVGSKPKMYSLLIVDNSEHKKAKGVNRNFVATVSCNECKDVFLNDKRISEQNSK